MFFYFNQWVIIPYNYLLWCSSCHKLSPWDPLRAGVCVLLIRPHHFLSISLCFDTKRCSKHIWHFPCSNSGISHFFTIPGSFAALSPSALWFVTQLRPHNVAIERQNPTVIFVEAEDGIRSEEIILAPNNVKNWAIDGLGVWDLYLIRVIPWNY